jgi:anti-sigma regulatory factor (Ser/Thr protein kinase)
MLEDRTGHGSWQKKRFMADTSTSSGRTKGLEISLPARAENVAVVRHALAGLAEEIGMDPPGIADLKTVVTEACMNVVVHAYDGEAGPLEVEAQPTEDGLTVVVRDSGVGIRPRPEVAPSSLRLGLSLIAALSSSFSFSGGLGRGTEVEMHLPLDGGGAEDGGPPAPVAATSDTTEIIVGRSDLLAPILSRIVGALAARRDLSVDRVSDAVLLTDAIADAAPGRFADGKVRLALADDDGVLELRLGPMREGGAEEVRQALAVPDVGGSLEALADEFLVEPTGDGDYLGIRFKTPAPAP